VIHSATGLLYTRGETCVFYTRYKYNICLCTWVSE